MNFNLRDLSKKQQIAFSLFSSAWEELKCHEDTVILKHESIDEFTDFMDEFVEAIEHSARLIADENHKAILNDDACVYNTDILMQNSVPFFSKITKHGDSKAITIPRAVREKLCLKFGDYVEGRIKKSSINRKKK
jgi:hypothetical protein